MMADDKEQRVCLKYCFLLGISAAGTILMLRVSTSSWHFSRSFIQNNPVLFPVIEIQKNCDVRHNTLKP